MLLLLLPAFLEPDLLAEFALFPRVFFFDGAGGVTWKEKQDNVALSFAVKTRSNISSSPSFPSLVGAAFLPALAVAAVAGTQRLRQPQLKGKGDCCPDGWVQKCPLWDFGRVFKKALGEAKLYGQR